MSEQANSAIAFRAQQPSDLLSFVAMIDGEAHFLPLDDKGLDLFADHADSVLLLELLFIPFESHAIEFFKIPVATVFRVRFAVTAMPFAHIFGSIRQSDFG